MSLPFHWVILDGVILFVFLAWIYRKRALKHVTYERYFSQATACEGDHIEMVEKIANRKLLPIPWLRLESFLSRDLVFGRQANLDIHSGELFQNHLSLFSMRPYRQIIRRHQVKCGNRGWYKLESATMTAGDPLGMVRVTRQFPLALELLVYPRAADLRELPLPSHSLLGDLIVKRWISPDPFLAAGVREYHPGDSLRQINWKATARTGELQVNRLDYTADHRLVVCLNVETSGAMWGTATDPERIELGIRYVAAIAALALGNGIQTGLLCNGRLPDSPPVPIALPPLGGSVQHEDILTVLAKLQLKSSANMAYLLNEELERAAVRTDYLIVSCHRDEKLRQAVEQLRRRGHGIEWLDIPKLAERTDDAHE